MRICRGERGNTHIVDVKHFGGCYQLRSQLGTFTVYLETTDERVKFAIDILGQIPAMELAQHKEASEFCKTIAKWNEVVKEREPDESLREA